MRPFFLILIISLTVFCPVMGQPMTYNSVYYTTPAMQSLLDPIPSPALLVRDCRHLSLDLDASGFFYDAEHAMPFAKGYTVAGFHLAPTLSYGINERAQLQVGFNAVAFAGLDSLYRLRPTFSLLYAPTQWLTLVVGTLYGSLNHQLTAPVYDPSHWIFDNQEDGLQILTRTDFWQSDTWLDWTHYLTPWTSDQERFTMGSQHTLNIARITTRWDSPQYCCMVLQIDTTQEIQNLYDASPRTRGITLDLPFHFIANHRGGEIKTLDTNTVTTFNERIGLCIGYMFQKSIGTIHRWHLDLPLYHYHLEDNTLDNSGLAFYPMLRYELLHLTPDERKGWSLHTTVGYWYGDHYFSAYGSPQFWSANAYSQQHIRPSADLYNATDLRNMLTFSLGWEHEFKGLNLGFQTTAYYDLDLKKADFLFSFYMRFLGHFRLL